MLIIDKKSRTPIYEQIVNQYKTLIACDVLLVGDQLESVRKLSSELGVNPNTIQKAYIILENEFICHSEVGKGRFVTADAKNIILDNAKKNTEKLNKIIYDLVLYGMDADELHQMTKRAYEKANKNINGIKSTD